MAENVDERIPENLFVNMMIEKGYHHTRLPQTQAKYVSLNHSGQHRTHYGHI